MAASLGDLEVRLSANIARFEQGLNRAERVTRQRSDGMRKAFATVGRSIVLLAGAGGLGLLINKTLSSADAIAKLNKQTEFGVERLQRYQFAAEQSGVGQETFNKAIQGFTKRIGELKADTGSLAEFLRKYDTQLVDTLKNTKSSSDAFNILVKRYNELSSATDKAALSNAAFGRAGILLTPMLNENAEGIKALGDQLENVFTEEQVAAAERANDAWNRLKKAAENLGNQIIIMLAGPMERLADWMRQGIDFANRLRDSWKDVADVLGEGGQSVEQTIIAQSESNIAALNAQLDNLRARLEQLQGGGFMGFMASIFEVEENQLKTEIAELEKLLDIHTTTLQRAKDDQERLTTAMEEAADAAGKLDKAYGELEDSLTDYQKKLQKEQEAYEGLWDQLIELDDALQRNIIGWDVYNKHLKRIERALGLVEEKTKKVKKETYELSGEFKKALAEVDRELQTRTNRIESLFEEFQRGVFDSWVGFWEDLLHNRTIDSFKSFFDSVKNLFISLLAQMAALWTASKFLELLNIGGVKISVPGLATSAATTAGTSAIGAKLASFFGGAATTSSGAGGAVAAGTLGGATAYALPATAAIPAGVPLAGPGVTTAYALPATPAIPAGVPLAGPGAGISSGLAAGISYGGPAMVAAGILYEMGLFGGKGPSTRQKYEDVLATGGLRNIAPGITAGQYRGGTGFLQGISRGSAIGLLGIEEVVDTEAMDGYVEGIYDFIDGIAVTKERYEQLVQAIEDGSGTIIGSQENLQKRVDAAMARMSDATIKQFAAIETNSRTVADAVSDGFVTSAELSSLGLQNLEGMSRQMFEAIIANARAAASAIAQVGEAAGGAAPQLGPAPTLTTPSVGYTSPSFDIGELAAQHGGRFSVNGKSGVDQNMLGVSTGEEVQVRKTANAGKDIQLLQAILQQLQRQGSDMSRLMAAI